MIVACLVLYRSYRVSLADFAFIRYASRRWRAAKQMHLRLHANGSVLEGHVDQVLHEIPSVCMSAGLTYLLTVYVFYWKVHLRCARDKLHIKHPQLPRSSRSLSHLYTSVLLVCICEVGRCPLRVKH